MKDLDEGLECRGLQGMPGLTFTAGLTRNAGLTFSGRVGRVDWSSLATKLSRTRFSLAFSGTGSMILTLEAHHARVLTKRRIPGGTFINKLHRVETVYLNLTGCLMGRLSRCVLKLLVAVVILV